MLPGSSMHTYEVPPLASFESSLRQASASEVSSSVCPSELPLLFSSLSGHLLGLG